MKKLRNSEDFSTKYTVDQGEKHYIETEEKVRYSEVDRMGIAHNKNYFEWFEIGRTEYCSRKYIPYKDIENQGYYLVLVEAFCRYKKPLRYDENFVIRTRLAEIVPKKVVFSYELMTEEKKLVAHGYTVHIVTNAKAQVCSLPPTVIGKLKAPLS